MARFPIQGSGAGGTPPPPLPPDPFANYIFLEDFIYMSSPGILDKYTIFGTSALVDSPAGIRARYGTAQITTNNVAGATAGLSTKDNGGINTTTDNWTMKQIASLESTLAQTIVILGMSNEDTIDGTTIATAESDFAEASYFSFDPNRSANWFANSVNATVKTETDTGVTALLTTSTNYEIIHTNGVSEVFKINGSIVATHTTNLPSGAVNSLGILSSINTLDALFRNLELDLWFIESTRDNIP